MTNTRTANFSSSAISALMSKGAGAWTMENTGKPFATYVKQKQREKRLLKPLDKEQNARPTSWGNLLEPFAFEKMPMDYVLESKKRYKHSKLPWSGAPDLVTTDKIKVGDIKCPWTLNAFCDVVEAMAEGVEEFKKVKPEYYWQLVSNAVLTGATIAEIWIYCPYTEDLEEVRELARGFDGEQNEFAFVNWASDEELPSLNKKGEYQDINYLSFEVPEEDKKLLIGRVEMAAKLLNPKK